MRLIDCWRNPHRLVNVWEQYGLIRYVALSYVWGKTNGTETVPPFPELPRRLPTVVQDAIKVTKKLHERYLWVDRYCIPPRDADEKENHEQFSNMDLIYAGAELTIVAGAGGDAAYGLPSVSTRK
jgi:hypothetical protein